MEKDKSKEIERLIALREKTCKEMCQKTGMEYKPSPTITRRDLIDRLKKEYNLSEEDVKELESELL